MTPQDVEMPRDYAAAQLVRQREPYHYQRNRQSLNRQPRPSQANTNQPNQKIGLAGWGLSTRQYWQDVFNNYLNRLKLTQETSLRMGREKL